MGMFDEITVPKSYLRNLLGKEDEKLFKKDHVFQTKDLDNVMDLYKIHRRQLYKLNRSGITLEEGAQHTSLVDQWDKIEDNISINFYDFLEDRKGDPSLSQKSDIVYPVRGLLHKSEAPRILKFLEIEKQHFHRG